MNININSIIATVFSGTIIKVIIIIIIIIATTAIIITTIITTTTTITTFSSSQTRPDQTREHSCSPFHDRPEEFERRPELRQRVVGLHGRRRDRHVLAGARHAVREGHHAHVDVVVTVGLLFERACERVCRCFFG